MTGRAAGPHALSADDERDGDGRARQYPHPFAFWSLRPALDRHFFHEFRWPPIVRLRQIN